MEHFLKCINCGRSYSSEELLYSCETCDDLLEIKYDYREIDTNRIINEWSQRPLNVWRYRELLPIQDSSKIISLQEGGTSLHPCTRLGDVLHLKFVYVKNEGQNPTGSFKDRGMTVGISKAVEMGAKVVICASTGNTSASLAAYAAKANLKSIVVIPSGKIALGKLTQAMVHGAKIIQIKGNFDDALKAVVTFSNSRREMYLLNSINPYRIEGQKTLAYEIYNQLGNKTPNTVILPVGNAGNITAVWKGFADLAALGIIKKMPRMIGIQAENASPIAQAFRLKERQVRFINHPETIASAIRIGAPVSWKKAMDAIYASKGLMETVSDDEILEAQKLLARREGLFIEPASATSIAGLQKLNDRGLFDKTEVIVCVATGHGLKDPDIVLQTYEKPVEVEIEGSFFENVMAELSSCE
jgi:threonine synthase